MAGHTPGPWRRCSACNGYCKCNLIWSVPADRAVAQAWSDKNGYGVDQEVPPADEARANAELIAMAPTMLEFVRSQPCDCQEFRSIKCDRCNILEVIDGPAMQSKSIGELIDEHTKAPAPRGEL